MLVILALFLAGHVIIRFILVSTTDVVTIVSENSMCLAIVCDICMINMAPVSYTHLTLPTKA